MACAIVCLRQGAASASCSRCCPVIYVTPALSFHLRSDGEPCVQLFVTQLIFTAQGSRLSSTKPRLMLLLKANHRGIDAMPYGAGFIPAKMWAPVQIHKYKCTLFYFPLVLNKVKRTKMETCETKGKHLVIEQCILKQGKGREGNQWWSRCMQQQFARHDGTLLSMLPCMHSGKNR